MADDARVDALEQQLQALQAQLTTVITQLTTTTNTDQSPTKVKSDKRSKNKALLLAKALIAMTTDADGHESISNSDDDSV